MFIFFKSKQNFYKMRNIEKLRVIFSDFKNDQRIRNEEKTGEWMKTMI